MSGAAFAHVRNLESAMGLVTICQLQVAFIGSGAIGGGELTLGKRRCGITVAGLGIGGIGASMLRATGTVYGLRSIIDFTGSMYNCGKAGRSATSGRGGLWLRNANGVTLRLAAQRKGLQFSLGAVGVLISFKQ